MIKEAIDERIAFLMEELDNYEVGSKEREAIEEELVKLHRMRIEEERLKNEQKRNADEAKHKTEELKHSKATEQAKRKEAKTDRVVKVATTAGEILIPLIFYGMWLQGSYDYEMNGGSHSLFGFRNLVNNFKPINKRFK